MEQRSTSSFSNEDVQLIHKYHLGNPLKVYQPTSRAIHLDSALNLLVAVMCVPVGIWGLLASLPEMGPLSAGVPFVRIGTCLLFGGFAVAALVDATRPHTVLKGAMLGSFVIPLFITLFAGWSWMLGFKVFLAFLIFAVGVFTFATRHRRRKTRLIV